MSGYAMVAAIAMVLFLIMAVMTRTGRIRIESSLGVSDTDFIDYDKAKKFTERYYWFVATFYGGVTVLLYGFSSTTHYGVIFLLLPFISNHVYLRPRLENFLRDDT